MPDTDKNTPLPVNILPKLSKSELVIVKVRTYSHTESSLELRYLIEKKGVFG